MRDLIFRGRNWVRSQRFCA